MCHMHSSEEQDPLCGQPLPPPHLSLGARNLAFPILQRQECNIPSSAAFGGANFLRKLHLL